MQRLGIVHRALCDPLDCLGQGFEVWRLSVSVGSNISASSTINGK